MKAAQRQIELRRIFETQEFADLKTLSEKLATSESTVRRDLAALESQGLIERVHGGAVAVARGSSAGASIGQRFYDFARQSERMADEKARIARAAVDIVEDGQMVILDGGSTVAAVARQLAGCSLHVLTNSLPIAEVFRKTPQIELTLTGGLVYPRLGVLLGPLCEQMLASVAADLLIMGTGGITEAGFSNNNTLLVASERKMIEVSRRVVIVADHTKFGRAAMVPLAPLDAAQVVISDEKLEQRYQSMLRSRGVEVVLA